MQWELDHVFLACPDRAVPQQVLADFGMTLVDGRVHRGQGTTNVCAFFENAFFELLLPIDDEELRSEVVAPLGLRERIFWQETGCCPFGICFRPSRPTSTPPPVEWWSYCPAYSPDGESIPIVTPRSSVFEPLVFLATGLRKRPIGSEHFGARRTLTAVAVQYQPKHSLSSGVQWFARNSSLSFVRGSRFHLEFVFDDARSGNLRDLDPLPVSVRW